MAKSTYHNIGAMILAILVVTHLGSVNAEESGNKNQQVAELISYIKIKGKKSTKVSTHWQSVITTNGELITMQYFPGSEYSKGHVSFWWRRAGTTDDASLWTSSVDLGGKVTGGSDPARQKGYMSDANPAIGEEHATFWDVECNKRIAAALAYYKKK